LRDGSVALVGCTDYGRGQVEERVAELFDLLGGPQAVAGSGQSVFLKINALLPSDPERGVTTNPEVVRAVVRQFQKVTGKVIIGDSPGGLYNRAMLKRTYRKTGMEQVAEETGATLNYDTSVALVNLPEASTIKTLTLCGAMLEADRLVSISKFKTHVFMNITAAIKNMFGAVPGMTKFAYHSRFSSERDFADLLVDVLLASGCDFHIVDAVVGMEGNGPRQGELKRMGVLAAGGDAFSVDAAMMRVAGLEPGVNLPLAAAVRRGIFSPGDPPAFPGDPPERLSVSGFRLPDKKNASGRIPEFVTRRFGHMVSLRPEPVAGRCTACRKCADICPADAITLHEGVAVVDNKRCIRCYCCHELCEEDAIELVRPPLMRIAGIR
jgi:uncharacterized protein (DUF362 family)/NAD-dependent dihydropyrimidine dehydrogenase PreA subunit